MVRGNKTLEARAELTERMTSNPSLLIQPVLTARSRFAAKLLQMKAGPIKLPFGIRYYRCIGRDKPPNHTAQLT